MAFNGSGTFNLAAGNPVVSGTTISSTVHNNTLSEIAAGLSTCVLKDGQQTLTAAIPFNSQRLTGLGDATAVTDAAKTSQVQNSAYINAGSVSGTNTITGTLSPTPSGYASGQTFILVPANTNTGATTLNLNSLGAKNVKFKGSALTGGELVANLPVLVRYDGTDFILLSTAEYRNDSPEAGTLHGMTLSNGTDADHDIDIATGQVSMTDGSSNYKQFTLSSALTKQVDANWAAGSAAGGFPSGLTLSTSTTYHVFVIGKTDGTVDGGFDTSLTAANLLTDASTYSWYRRIGSIYTDGTSNIVGFNQDGDEFLLDVPVGDYSSSNPGTSAVLVTLSVPTGIKVRAFMSFVLADSSPATVTNLLLTSPDQTDTAPTNTLMTLHLSNTDSSEEGSGTTYIRTNTSGQVRFRLDASTVDHFFRETTHGWIDTRGRLA